jgi:hypothetical protein
MVEEPDRTPGGLGSLGQVFEGLASDVAFQTAHDLRGSRAACCAGRASTRSQCDRTFPANDAPPLQVSFVHVWSLEDEPDWSRLWHFFHLA